MRAVLRGGVFAMSLAVTLPGAQARAIEPGAIVPFFKATDLQGRSISLGELTARKRVAVFFWDWRRATSTRAMQVLDRLQQTHGPQGFEVLAVEGEGTPAEQVLERVEKLRSIGTAQRYTIVPDPGGRIARQFRVRGTPELFLLDGAGRVSYHLEGFRAEDEEQVATRVRDSLGIQAPVAPPTPGTRAAAPPPVGAPSEPAAPAEAPRPADPTAALLERYRYFGNFHLDRGEPQKAEEYFRKYVALAPDDSAVWLRLGEACARQRRYDQAREAWEQVLRVDPENREADANIRRMIRGEY